MLLSPRRITVVVLAGVAGFAVQSFTEIERAVLPAILIGMVVALFVPAKGACPVSQTERPVPRQKTTH